MSTVPAGISAVSEPGLTSLMSSSTPTPVLFSNSTVMSEEHLDRNSLWLEDEPTSWCGPPAVLGSADSELSFVAPCDRALRQSRDTHDANWDWTAAITGLECRRQFISCGSVLAVL